MMNFLLEFIQRSWKYLIPSMALVLLLRSIPIPWKVRRVFLTVKRLWYMLMMWIPYPWRMYLRTLTQILSVTIYSLIIVIISCFLILKI